MLKWIAALLMLVDHAALLLLPYGSPLYIGCRFVGRLAMPIFAYKVALGFIHTKNFNKYLTRMLVMTLFAQVPFTYILYQASLPALITSTNGLIFVMHWNIGLTFSIVLLILHLMPKQTLGSSLTIFALLFVANYADYGIYGVLLVALFYMYATHRIQWRQLTMLFGLLCLFQLSGLRYASLAPLQALVVFFNATLPLVSLLLIRYAPDKPVRLPRYFFYVFYPLHMFILGVLYTFLV